MAIGALNPLLDLPLGVQSITGGGGRPSTPIAFTPGRLSRLDPGAGGGSGLPGLGGGCCGPGRDCLGVCVGLPFVGPKCIGSCKSVGQLIPLVPIGPRAPVVPIPQEEFPRVPGLGEVPSLGGCPPRAGAAAGVQCPSGCHPNKSDYFLRSGEFVPARSRCVRNRRRNPLNPRALDRAISRIGSAQNAVGRLGFQKKSPRRRKRSRPSVSA